jgi:hypothetical protein
MMPGGFRKAESFLLCLQSCAHSANALSSASGSGKVVGANVYLPQVTRRTITKGLRGDLFCVGFKIPLGLFCFEKVILCLG